MNHDQLLRLLEETHREVEKAESKASILLAGGSLATGTVTSVLLSGDISWETFNVATQVLFVASGGLMLLGLLFLGLSLVPRLRGNPGDKKMLAFFGHVTAMGSLEEFERMATETVDEGSRLTNQIWTLSAVIQRKYQFITRAFQCLGASILAGLLAYLAQIIWS